MQSKIKIIISILFFIGGGMFLLLHFNQSKPEKASINEVSIIIDEKETPSFASIFSGNSFQTSTAIFFIDSTPCSPCINNVFEYVDLLKKERVYYHAIFVDKERSEVERFFSITGLDMDWSIIKEDELPVELQGVKSRLAFLTEGSRFFYSVVISNNQTSSLEYKKRILKDALE
ncbi:MAG: hypothetical protein RLN81_12100 [Balneolaceae bacterium]